MIVLNVSYKCKPGMAKAFVERLEAEGIGAASRADAGNIKYDYYLPADGSDEVLLVEKWESAELLALHSKQPHLARIAEFKSGYVTETVLDRFEL